MKADLKIGDYVRTKYGISKIEKIEDDKTHKTTWYTVDKAQYHSFLVREQEIIKASDKLIDILNVGDFLDNHCIVRIENNTCYMNDGWFINENDIEDLVTFICTKEQFEQISYKVGD